MEGGTLMVQIFERGQLVKYVHCTGVDDAKNFVRVFNLVNGVERRAILAY